MTRPAVGVKPMLVAIDLPSFMAHTEAPLPRWQAITLPLGLRLAM